MQELKQLFRDSKIHVLTAVLIFVLGTWLGFVFHEAFESMVAQMLEELRDVAENLEESGNPLYMAWFIFQNNVRASLIMLGLGFVLFVIPVFSLFANGLAVGFVLQMSALQGELSPLKMFAFGILPHGILELPAVIVAGGVGLFLGLRFLGWLFGRGKFFAHVLGQSRNQDLGTFWREETLPVLKRRGKGLLALVVLIVVVLLVAAVIETFITPLLIHFFIGVPM